MYVSSLESALTYGLMGISETLIQVGGTPIVFGSLRLETLCMRYGRVVSRGKQIISRSDSTVHFLKLDCNFETYKFYFFIWITYSAL